MKTYYNIVCLSLFILSGTLITRAQEIDPGLAAGLQNILNTHHQQTGTRGMSAAVLLPNGNTWKGTVGFSFPIAGQEITPEMQFCMASITKTFVAAEVLLLEDQGFLSLADSLHQYLPDFPNIAGEITIQQLLNHTSGIYDFVNHPNVLSIALSDPGKNWHPEEVVQNFVLTPSFSPGSTWGYSNTNYVLLGMIIESVTGEKLGAQLKSNFLNPLGLNNIQLPIEEQLNGPVAVPWFDTNGDGNPNNGTLVSLDSALMSFRWATGGLYSTPEQLAIWGKNLYGGDVLSQDQLAKMLDFIELPDVGGWIGYGLGTQLYTAPGDRTMYGHNGAVLGYGSALRYSPGDDISVAVLSNDNLPNTHAIARELLVFAGDFLLTPTEEHNPKLEEIQHQAYPNPFENEMLISYRLPSNVRTEVEINIFNALGQVIWHTLVHSNFNESEKILLETESFAKGIYFYEIKGGGFSATGSLVKQ